MTVAFSRGEERDSEIQNRYLILYKMTSFDETEKITKNTDTINKAQMKEGKQSCQ